jgi:hypothetical protein
MVLARPIHQRRRTVAYLPSKPHHIRATIRTLALATLGAAAAVSPAAAQNYNLDARVVGMGGIGSTRNIASKLVKERKRYHRIGIPLGLFQVLPNRQVFFPDVKDDVVSDDFDLFRAMEYAAGPVNYTFGRDDTATGQRLVNDVLSDRLNHDLNAYRQFSPATKLTAEGLGTPNWGYAFKFDTNGSSGAYQAIYAGAGPYASVTTETLTDPDLVDVLGSPVPKYVPNAIFDVNHQTTFQLAAAITGGYRLARPMSSLEDGRPQGFFAALNFNYLRGVHYDDLQMDIQFETNASGIIPDTATRSTPLALDYMSSTKGRGLAVDAGFIYMINRWDFGVGVNGIANRITWTGVELDRYREDNLSGGDEGETTEDIPVPDVTVELPLNLSANVGYHAGRWSTLAEYSRRFNGNNVQGGVEYLFGNTAIRGGARYARDRWHPHAGVGFDLSEGFGIDVALYGSSTNAERRRHVSLAVSLRFQSKPGNDAP